MTGKRERSPGREHWVLERKTEHRHPRLRLWLRWLAAAFLTLILLLVVFHRPLVFEGTRYFIVRAAEQQHLDLRYEIDGSIFTTLEIKDLRAVPTEQGPIQRLEIGALRLRYSLVDLVRSGMPAFLELVEVQDVFVEITPEEPLPPDKEKKPQQFKFPALFPEILRIVNVNVLVHAKDGDTVLEGLHFSLLPDQPGGLRLTRLALPGLGGWKDIAAATRFHDRHLVLTDFSLPPLATLREFELDLSGLDENVLAAGLAGDVLDAAVDLRLRIEDLNATNRFDLKASVSDAGFEPILAAVDPSIPLRGALTRFDVVMAGEIERPATWTGQAGAQADSIVWEGEEAGPVFFHGHLKDGQAIVSLWAGVGATNAVALNARASLPADMQGWNRTDADFEFSARADDLSNIPAGEVPIAGWATVLGSGSYREETLDAVLQVEAGRISAAGLDVESVRATARVVRNLATLENLAVRISENNLISAQGRFQLDGEQEYAGRIDAQLGDLSIFQDLAGGKPVGGQLAAWWAGEGKVRPMLHSGSFGVNLDEARFDTVDGASASTGGSYAPEFINVPDVTLAASGVRAGLSLFWTAGRVSVPRLEVTLREKPVFQGTASVPLRLDPSAPQVPLQEPVEVALRADDFDLRRLFDEIGIKEPPVTGRLNASVDVRGTLENPEAQIRLNAAGLRSAAVKDLQPASADVRIDLQNKAATLDVAVRQPPLRPLAVAGRVPFDVPAIVQNGKVDPETPLDIRANLLSSQLDVIGRIVPAIRRIEGTASVDARIVGTVAQPQASGRVEANIRAIRMADSSLPPVGGVTARIDLDGERVTIQRLTGSSAGGYFDVGGTIGIAPLDNPALDIRLRAGNLLVLRNDDITARISSDVRVNGTLAQSTVSGTVWVTRSRFLRNIEILPIGLPGRPAPQPPAEPLVVSFPDPPLRDWRFDLAIRTADPFRIQGNLANGRVIMDLRLLGTGLNPWMEGTVTIEELVTSLPFSRLRIENGQVFFTRQDPFVPQLNIQGRSTIREYEVNVLVTGTANDPEALFTSNPPLPQSEVVTLMATGMTTNELGNDPNALAGRAAILGLQRAYRALFQRNRPPPDDESFLNRIQFEAGATDPRTGQQSAQVGIPLSEQVVLTGGVDVGGNVQGQVRYLIRFR